MKKVWAWVAAGLVVALAAVLAAYYRLKGDQRAAANAKADATEKNAAPKIAAATAQLEVLKKDEVKNEKAIKDAEQDLAQQKEQLNAKFVSHGLTADEIVGRFQRLQLK